MSDRRGSSVPAMAVALTAALLPTSGGANEAGGHGAFVVTGVAAERAAAIAAEADALRATIRATVFGDAAPPWVPPCTIHVHADRASFVRAVGGAPTNSGGATTVEFSGDTISLRRVDVLDAPAGGMPGALAHELVHVVLADHFRSAPPPRWADEGLATLFDQPAKQRGHESDFRVAAARGQAWSVADLMALELDPADVARQRVFYGQSAALVRWLLDRADGPTFVRFLDDAATVGVERAVVMHYPHGSVAALERAWLAEPSAPRAMR